jgi:serine phosphatase RsbU (regulator of sigma subunit)
MMPVMTGEQFLQEVKNSVDLRDIPFVLLTAKSSMESKISNLGNGADDYLNKPFSEAELKARIKNLVTLRKQQLQIKSELIAARNIQRSLMPPLVQDLSGFQIDALYQPCTELSGDFFDTHARGDWIYLYVADVTSHGTASAQVTYLIKGIFQDLLDAQLPPDLTTLLNDFARRYNNFKLDYMIGLSLVRVNVQTKMMEYAGSGAPPLILVRDRTSQVLSPERSSSILWELARAGSEFKTKSFQLASGDKLHIFTDGCTEFAVANSEQEFGERRLKKVLTAAPDRDREEFVLTELKTAHGSSSFPDDLTLVTLKVK